MTVLWRIKAYDISENGWSSALDLKTPMLSKSHSIESFALDTVGKSNDWQYFTFTPKQSSNIWNAKAFSKSKTVMMMVTFNFIDDDEGNIQEDIEAVISASNYYYKEPAGDQSCAVDRFDCYPT